MKKLINLVALLFSLSLGATVSYGPSATPPVTNLQGRNVSATAPADTNVLSWDAASSSWKPAAAGAGGSGFDTIGAFGSSPDAKGASSSGTTITIQPADATHPGAVTTGSQSFAGVKTFTAGIASVVTGDVTGNLTGNVTGNVSGTAGSATGNAATATALAANPSDCASDTYANAIAASGNLTCSTVTNAGLAGSIAYSKLSLTGAVLNADLAGSIAYSKLSLTGAVLNADLAGSIAASKLVGSDIATVGTITTGVWSGTPIVTAKLADTMPKIVASAAVTGQTADFSATTLFTPSADGFFRLNCYSYISTAATSSSTVPSVRVTYTIPETNTALTASIVVAVFSTNALNVQNVGSRFFKAKSGVAIQYSTQGYLSSGATAMIYGFTCNLEKMD